MNLTAIAVALGILAATATGSYLKGQHDGSQAVQTRWDQDTADRKAVEATAILTRVKNNERIAEQNEIKERKMKDDYTAEIARSRAAANSPYSLRLKADTLCRGFAPTATAQTASGSPETFAGTIALPDQIARDLRRLAQDADEVLAQCRLVQQYIVKAQD